MLEVLITTTRACPHDQLDTDAAHLAHAAGAVLDQIRDLGDRHACPPASWSWETRYPDGQLTLSAITGSSHPHTAHAAHHAAQQWATTLGLTASRRALPGCVEFTGTINSLPIKVWAVVDRHQFDNRAWLHEVQPYPAPAVAANHTPCQARQRGGHRELLLAGLLALTAAAVLANRTGALAKLTAAITR